MFKKKDEAEVEEEILSMVEEGQDQGFIQEDEAEMISNIFDFNDKQAHDIMTARNKMFVLEHGITIEEALRRGLRSGYSRYHANNKCESGGTCYKTFRIFHATAFQESCRLFWK